jgi:hypothetical protein
MESAMSSIRRFAIPLTGAALGLLLAVPAAASLAAPASASTMSAHGVTRLHDAIPPDCSWRFALPHWGFLTCTKRPASQQWRVGADCFNYATGTYAFAYGSTVTGDGLSTINCAAPRDQGFFPVS